MSYAYVPHGKQGFVNGWERGDPVLVRTDNVADLQWGTPTAPWLETEEEWFAYNERGEIPAETATRLAEFHAWKAEYDEYNRAVKENDTAVLEKFKMAEYERQEAEIARIREEAIKEREEQDRAKREERRRLQEERERELEREKEERKLVRAANMFDAFGAEGAKEEPRAGRDREERRSPRRSGGRRGRRHDSPDTDDASMDERENPMRIRYFRRVDNLYKGEKMHEEKYKLLYERIKKGYSAKKYRGREVEFIHPRKESKKPLPGEDARPFRKEFSSIDRLEHVKTAVQLFHTSRYKKRFLEDYLQKDAVAEFPKPNMEFFLPYNQDVLKKDVYFDCASTLAAFEDALHTKTCGMSLGGGHTQAAPHGGDQYCVVNDIAISLQVLRAKGMLKKGALVMDFTSHRPNGLNNFFPPLYKTTVRGGVLGVYEPEFAVDKENDVLRFIQPHNRFGLEDGDVLDHLYHHKLNKAKVGRINRPVPDYECAPEFWSAVVEEDPEFSPFFERIPHPYVKTVSLHAPSDAFEHRRRSFMDNELSMNAKDEEYLEMVKQTLQDVEEYYGAKEYLSDTFDLVVYVAGADPHKSSVPSISSLDVSKEALRQRDRWVFKFCEEAFLPTAAVLAGGYSANVKDVVDIHYNTFKEMFNTFYDKKVPVPIVLPRDDNFRLDPSSAAEDTSNDAVIPSLKELEGNEKRASSFEAFLAAEEGTSKSSGDEQSKGDADLRLDVGEVAGAAGGNQTAWDGGNYWDVDDTGGPGQAAEPESFLDLYASELASSGEDHKGGTPGAGEGWDTPL
ncbi:unnamed protein product [Amoebophrya sp. A120]|nr:unnamed protein product [Amoebophrya sp. A120]|eukprot:GSA120T00022723001.1